MFVYPAPFRHDCNDLALMPGDFPSVDLTSFGGSHLCCSLDTEFGKARCSTGICKRASIAIDLFAHWFGLRHKQRTVDESEILGFSNVLREYKSEMVLFRTCVGVCLLRLRWNCNVCARCHLEFGLVC